jgi:predicted XRE-type DNA-binding protein
MKTNPSVTLDAGNLFVDRGWPIPEEHLLKTAPAVQLGRLLKARKLTPTAAAKIVSIKPSDLSDILSGRDQSFSLERLMRMLTAFNQDVEITVSPRLAKGKTGRITFNAFAA